MKYEVRSMRSEKSRKFSISTTQSLLFALGSWFCCLLSVICCLLSEVRGMKSEV